MAKLLLAEDSLTIQKVFELTFKQSGISLTMVDNGIDAVRLAKEISPDLVVADVSLPGKDGFEVASELRVLGGTPGSCPVLILAGSLAPFNEGRFKSCGAQGVLFKPFESQELIEKVEALLRTKEEPAPALEEREEVPPSTEEPWDFSDVLTEVEEEAGAAPVSRTAGAEDFTGLLAPPAEGAEIPFSMRDFDVSLEDIEGEPERGEAVGSEAEPPKEEDVGRILPPEDSRETAGEAVEHIEEPWFDDSPPPVLDLSAALESVEEVAESDFLESIEPPEKREPAPDIREEAEIPAPPVSPEILPGEAEPESEPSPPAAQPLPGEPELRELFSARAQEIFGKVAAETVEKVMWEVMEKLSKEFNERIRESVEAVAWEVVPATAEALIREEIARIREQDGKESS